MFSSNILSVLGISTGSYMIIFVVGTPTRVPQLQPAFFVLLLQNFSDFSQNPFPKFCYTILNTLTAMTPLPESNSLFSKPATDVTHNLQKG